MNDGALVVNLNYKEKHEMRDVWHLACVGMRAPCATRWLSKEAINMEWDSLMLRMALVTAGSAQRSGLRGSRKWGINMPTPTLWSIRCAAYPVELTINSSDFGNNGRRWMAVPMQGAAYISQHRKIETKRMKIQDECVLCRRRCRNALNSFSTHLVRASVAIVSPDAPIHGIKIRKWH